MNSENENSQSWKEYKFFCNGYDPEDFKLDYWDITDPLISEVLENAGYDQKSTRQV